MKGFKLWWDEENQIIRQVAPEGIHDSDTSKKIIEEIAVILQEHPGASILVEGHDNNLLTKGSGEMFRDAVLAGMFSKIAYVNINPIIEYDISYLVNSFPQPEKLLEVFQIFTDIDEAIAWLKS